MIEKEITVIIPNYNKGKYIKQCINSVLDQTYKPYEIIVVDDCSTDNSRLIIEEIAREHDNVRLICQEENGGVSKARNTGLEAAQSEYVTFIDSDDYYSNRNKLENEMKLILAAKEPHKAIAYSVMELVTEDGSLISGKLTGLENVYIYGKHPLAELLSLKRLRVGPRDYVIAKGTLEAVGAYSFEKNLYEDLDLLMRLAVDKIDFLCTRQIGTAYRQGTGGLSSAQKNEHEQTRDSILKKYYEYASPIEKLISILVKLEVIFCEGLMFVPKRIKRLRRRS